MASKGKTTISVSTDEDMKAAIAEWQKLMGFTSQRAFCEHLMFVGLMCHEMVAGKPLTAENFANALYTIGSHFLAGSYRGNMEETIEEFQAWRKTKASHTVRHTQVGSVLVTPMSPERKLG
jgi:hypothetical protein